MFFCKIYTAGVIYFGLNCALASTAAFLPTIITTFGYCALNLITYVISKVDILAANALAQLLTVPPYAVAAVLLTLLSLISDRLQSRGIIMAISSSLGGLGYLSVFPFSLCSNLTHLTDFS